jgi:hypothetical protein
MIGKYMTATVTEAERTISLSSYADFGLPVPLSLKVAREDQPSVSDFGNLVQHIHSKVLEQF